MSDLVDLDLINQIHLNFQGVNLEHLPPPLIIKILKRVLEDENDIERIDILLNIQNFKIIDCLFQIQPKLLSLMNTRLWLRILSSMGYSGRNHFNTPTTFEWHSSVIEYQRNLITRRLYRNRVHDLIDCVREGNPMARFLLQRLYIRAIDPVEREFLSGRQQRIQPRNDTFHNLLNQWLRGQIICPPIKYWDVRKVRNMRAIFYGVDQINFDINLDRHFDLTYWDVSRVTNMTSMFINKNQLIFTGLENWNTSRVTNMSYMFLNTTTNSDISNWDVSRVTDMSFMFDVDDHDLYYPQTYFNQNIKRWDTRRVTNMAGMFLGARDFNQNIGRWNTSRVTNMSYMFNGAIAFNQDIGRWDTSRVENMRGMFRGATAFNQVLNWNVIRLTHDVDNGMFRGSMGSITEERKEERRETIRRRREMNRLKYLQRRTSE
jgi:surface protein